ncbi:MULTISPECIES: DUF4037 domain-containing protein [unclassified Leptotrichia]|uniref:DUF4037 domain-containing protein n=1 Tax=unclassified Leptotrichia TaxID=2633022 RepID=UPI0003ADE783|nr:MULTISPECIES: DUF4037 domain-containing protein [unclassified Leptotrichia]ERL26937.1 hypothetical protein HMPREF9108_00488 [Leptotrichia sp. oral taxon 225 str. F0581]WLD73782.1 DUF4037 domain-containing protein [Leptotrichia sp. HMT-225]
MVEQLFKELSLLEEVEAIALGDSRAGENYDEKSDYDVYLYVNSPISEEKRKNILQKFCSYMEIGNSFWEYEDNCVLNNGIEIDILYRDMKDFMKGIERVVAEYHPSNSYTTCMWHNLITCKILYDKNGTLEKYKNKYTINYPKQLKENIIKRQLELIDSSMPAYPNQIKKAILRKDFVSINHRITEFLASYFDLLFAINEITHPGEKRLIQLCKKQCKILPENFEENLNSLFSHMYSEENQSLLMNDIENIVNNIKKISR